MWEKREQCGWFVIPTCCSCPKSTAQKYEEARAENVAHATDAQAAAQPEEEAKTDVPAATPAQDVPTAQPLQNSDQVRSLGAHLCFWRPSVTRLLWAAQASEEEIKAANKIQAAFRGGQTRKTLKEQAMEKAKQGAKLTGQAYGAYEETKSLAKDVVVTAAMVCRNARNYIVHAHISHTTPMRFCSQRESMLRSSTMA